MESLDGWANKLPMEKFDVRPSIQVTRSWQLADVVRDRTGQLIAASMLTVGVSPEAAIQLPGGERGATTRSSTHADGAGYAVFDHPGMDQ